MARPDQDPIISAVDPDSRIVAVRRVNGGLTKIMVADRETDQRATVYLDAAGRLELLRRLGEPDPAPSAAPSEPVVQNISDLSEAQVDALVRRFTRRRGTVQALQRDGYVEAAVFNAARTLPGWVLALTPAGERARRTALAGVCVLANPNPFD